MKVLLDTDLASAFAKVGRLELLVRLFVGIDLGIAFEVYKELLVPLGHGYHFPEAVFAICETTYPHPEEMATVQRRLVDMKALGRGELETITIYSGPGGPVPCAHRKARRRSWRGWLRPPGGQLGDSPRSGGRPRATGDLFFRSRWRAAPTPPAAAGPR
jgi:hypothetical protein